MVSKLYQGLKEDLSFYKSYDPIYYWRLWQISSLWHRGVVLAQTNLTQ